MSDNNNNKTNDNMNEQQQEETTMLAYCIVNTGDTTTGQVVRMPRPRPDGPGFALIRVLRAGVCNTDLEMLKGYMGGFTGVLGHEFVGIVHNVYDQATDGHWIGKRVCGDINVGCATCHVCLDTNNKGDARCPNMSRNHCPHRSVLGILHRNGTMAEYVTLPVRNLHLVPSHVPDAVAVFAEPLAAACRIVEQALVRPVADRVAILGDGKLGLMIAEVLGRTYLQQQQQQDAQNNAAPVDTDHSPQVLPPPPILFGKHQHKLDLVRDSGVVGKLVSECQENAAATNKNNNSGGVVASPTFAGQFDVVVDATGNPDGLALAVALCRPMGTLVLKSTCAATAQGGFHAAPLVIHELHVVGSRCGPIDQALRLLAITNKTNLKDIDNHSSNGGIPSLNVEKYITKTFPLAQAAEAIQCAAEKSTMKVQIICSES